MNLKAAGPIHCVFLKPIAFELYNTLDIKINFTVF